MSQNFETQFLNGMSLSTLLECLIELCTHHSVQGLGPGRSGPHGGDPVRADAEGGLGRAHPHPLVQGHLRHTHLQVSESDYPFFLTSKSNSRLRNPRNASHCSDWQFQVSSWSLLCIRDVHVLEKRSSVWPPTKESRDPALGLADGMKFLLRFGDDRSAVSAPAALAADGWWSGGALFWWVLMKFSGSELVLPPKPGHYHSLDSQP